MQQWMTAKEAAETYGLSRRTLHFVVRRDSWESKKLQEEDCNGHKHWCQAWRTIDIEEYMRTRKPASEISKDKTDARNQIVCGLVTWADEQDRFPTQEQIKDQTSERWGVKDIMAIFEARPDSRPDLPRLPRW